ncbi:hypothetical protein PM082_020025 [Marasmius tenuissimus]|nr:hypothetical protein PM082_020025 [Marasmius tenuissimus]
MSTPSIILQVPLLVLSVVVHQYAVKPPRKIPVTPCPPQQALFLEKMEWAFMRVATPGAQVKRLEVHVAALLEIMFIAGSRYSFHRDYLPDAIIHPPSCFLDYDGIEAHGHTHANWWWLDPHNLLSSLFGFHVHLEYLQCQTGDTKLVTSGPL